MKDPKQIAKGKKNRASGVEFERRVRKDLEEKGWIVDKWGNNVEFDWRFKNEFKRGITGGQLLQGTAKLIPAKRKWNNFTKTMMMGSGGFPDFICFKRLKNIIDCEVEDYELGITVNDIYGIIGIECKINGYLTKEEREKCQWLLDNQIFSKILIAEKTKVKNRIVIVYHNFKEKYGKKMAE